MNACRREILRFDHYRFDPQRLSLSDRNGSVTLRPQAARLLALFLAHGDCVLSKTFIPMAAWSSVKNRPTLC